MNQVINSKQSSELNNRWKIDVKFIELLKSILENRPGEEWYPGSPKIFHPWEKDETCDCRGMILEEMDFQKIFFAGYDLSFSSFRKSNFNGTRLQGAIVSNCDFYRAIFNSSQMLPIYGEHVNFESAVFFWVPALESTVEHSNFNRAKLEKIDFYCSQLKSNSFVEANILASEFGLTRMQHCDFTSSTIEDSRFVDADLSDTKFSGATLKNCDFRGANFSGVDLSVAHIQGGRFGDFHNGSKVSRTRIDDTPGNRKAIQQSGAQGQDEIEWLPVGALGHVRGRVVAGQPCTRNGFWFTPAQVGSRRYFKQGDVMPEIKSDYGETIWQWDQNQNPPAL